jgi:tetratricopeptide (TPR) repeat protein
MGDDVCTPAIEKAGAWDMVGRWGEAVALLHAVLPAAATPERRAAVLTALARVRNQQDWFNGPTGEDDKREAIDDVEAIARERDDARMLADALHERALDLHTLHFHGAGDLAAEEELFERAFALREECGDEEGAGWSLIYLATLHQMRAEHAAAQPLLEQVVAIAERADAPLLRSYGIRHLGMVHQEHGDWDAAYAAYAEALAVREQHGWVPYIATASHTVGSFLLACGETERARVHLERALAVGEPIGMAFMMNLVRADLATLSGTD